MKKKFSKGILIGTDETTEWMLKWWWKNYQIFNHFPIAIADFGMTKGALEFSRSIGMVIYPQMPRLRKPQRQSLIKWQEVYTGDLETCRPAWLKKPFAFQASPFEISLWIDLDCEILGKLDPLFSAKTEISLVKEPLRCQNKAFVHQLIPKNCILYNSGVVVFKKNAPILKKYLENVINYSHLFMGDQDILSWTFYQEKYSPGELSPIYNWRPLCGINKHAVILHHTGSHGKQNILRNL